MSIARDILTTARRRLGLSVGDIAEMLCCNLNTAYRIERGEPVRGTLLERVPAVYRLDNETAGRWLRARGER